ncbi:septum formation initiator [Serpentinimonas maccroryi]|uniref:Cell division protein FtsB n=1 Tax=Serpentinimonas maccroryi TaxID=1458426 RepID=A0A060NQL4_9BURK|nr:cell division protein FtsB [Serpentinimonas maccroryi]BAO83665.1 septum formation initiator [Serpentinimonas maccroryi]
MPRLTFDARAVALLLAVLLLGVQAQLWLGRGGVPQVRELRERLQVQETANEQARQRNAELASEVRDLQDGLEMVEEVARHELGMVRPNEIFVQIRRPESAAGVAAGAPSPASPSPLPAAPLNRSN